MTAITSPENTKQWSDILIKASKKCTLDDFAGDEFGGWARRHLVYDIDNKPTKLEYDAKFYNLPVGDTTFGDCYVTCGEYKFKVYGVFTFEVQFFSKIMAGDVEKIHAKSINNELNFNNPVHGKLTMPNDTWDSFDEAQHHLMLIGLACAD